jgi:hypothetical protein
VGEGDALVGDGQDTSTGKFRRHLVCQGDW